MLKTVDVLIGFTVVMLIMGMAVTLVTQAVASTLNLRGHSLKRGIATLLALLDRGLTPADAEKLARHLLRDPLISTKFLGYPRLATAVHREELTKMLLEFSVDKAVPDDMKAVQNTLKNSLQQNGITNPDITLQGIRKTALDLEKTNPEMANHERMSAAILHNADDSDYVAKLHAWFDQTMDRVSEMFTMRARIVTVGAAIVVAFALQLDSISLVNRLAVDDQFRNDLVKEVIKDPQKFDPSKAPEDIPALKNRGLDKLFQYHIIQLPSGKNEKHEWSFIGVLISAALISLGAPFWYEMLKNLVKFRSLIATKDEAERQQRQTSQAPEVKAAGAAAAPAAASAVVPAALAGERGDLNAIG